MYHFRVCSRLLIHYDASSSYCASHVSTTSYFVQDNSRHIDFSNFRNNKFYLLSSMADKRVDNPSIVVQQYVQQQYSLQFNCDLYILKVLCSYNYFLCLSVFLTLCMILKHICMVYNIATLFRCAFNHLLQQQTSCVICPSVFFFVFTVFFQTRI